MQSFKTKSLSRVLPAIVLALSALLAIPSSALAHVVRVVIDTREPIAGGASFGNVGAYERLTGRVYFAFDPANPHDRQIVDLSRAPRNERGEVEAWAEFVMLRPVDLSRGSGVTLLDVVNRGNMTVGVFHLGAHRELSPDSAGYYGDALLLRRGLTVVMLGWQWDILPTAPGLHFHAPVAGEAGHPITGLVRSDITVDAPTRTIPLGHVVGSSLALAYPVSDTADAKNQLTVRDDPIAPRRVIPRSEWQFAREDSSGAVIADSRNVYMRAGFEAGKIYEVVYRAENPVVVGTGLAAVRDMISYLKYDTGSIAPDEIRHRVRCVADGPLSSPFPVSGLQRRRARAQGVRRDLRAHRGCGAGLVQPSLRAAVARCTALHDVLLSNGRVPVHERGGERSGNRCARRAARASRARLRARCHRPRCSTWTAATNTGDARHRSRTRPSTANATYRFCRVNGDTWCRPRSTRARRDFLRRRMRASRWTRRVSRRSAGPAPHAARAPDVTDRLGEGWSRAASIPLSHDCARNARADQLHSSTPHSWRDARRDSRAAVSLRLRTAVEGGDRRSRAAGRRSAVRDSRRADRLDRQRSRRNPERRGAGAARDVLPVAAPSDVRCTAATRELRWDVRAAVAYRGGARTRRGSSAEHRATVRESRRISVECRCCERGARARAIHARGGCRGGQDSHGDRRGTGCRQRRPAGSASR